MFRMVLALAAAFSLAAEPQVVKKAEEAVEKTAKKTAKVTKEAATETVDGTKKVAKKTGQVAESATEKTVDATKTATKKTAAVTKDVAKDTADATKTGAKKVANAIDPKKPTGGKVNLNTATRAELIALPGIGEANADKIIKARPIASVEDLSSKKIIQNQYYEKVKGLVTVK